MLAVLSVVSLGLACVHRFDERLMVDGCEETPERRYFIVTPLPWPPHANTYLPQKYGCGEQNRGEGSSDQTKATRIMDRAG